MGIEIERKYLVNSREFKSLAEPVKIVQGYLVSDPDKVVRIRIKDSRAFLTIKSKVVQLKRLEFEYEIPLADAEVLIELCGKKIIKDRYEIVYKTHLWEVDEFFGKNEGLLLAEIELQSPDEVFEKPHWIGEEVSHDHRYFNAYLAENPYQRWSR